MAKILISSLGTGSLNPNNTSKRQYRTAVYKIDGQSYERSFIASVLYEHLQLDGMIFLGTVKSMWEEAYESFCLEKGLTVDEDYYVKLSDTIDNLNYQSPLDSIDLSKLEAVLGEQSKCILIKYGIQDSELQENLDKIIQIVDYLEDGDEIYIDITHSFRSLSLFLFLVLIFVKDLKADRNIKIAGIYYGMLDVCREFEYAPIVNLKSLFDLTQWIKGAYSLKNFGNGYLISTLLEQQGNDLLAKDIRKLSDAININYVPTIQQQAATLKKSIQSDQSSPFKYLKNILGDFIEQLSPQSHMVNPESNFQLKLASWYCKNKRYATAYITLAEAIITYVCEINSKDVKNKDDREKMKDILTQTHRDSSLSKIYVKINPIRNAIAHASFDKKRSSDSKAIQGLDSYLKETKQIFKTGKL